MKKILGLFVSMVIVSACSLTSKPSSTEDICDIFKEKRSWYKAAKKTEKRWNIPISVTMAILKQESSFIRDAKPNRKKLFGFTPWKRQSRTRVVIIRALSVHVVINSAYWLLRCCF